MKSKRIKGRQRKEQRKGAGLRSTGRSAATHRIVRSIFQQTLYSRVFLATSAIIHRTVRARRRTVRSTSRATAICHVDQEPTVIWRTRPSGAPQKRKPTNQEILYRVLCSYCSLSGVHWIVRCAHGQKARIAYQMELQRLLAALGL